MAPSPAKIAQPDPEGAAHPAPFVESRRLPRQSMTFAVRLGWINDDKRMEYQAARGLDVSASGMAVWTARRLRLSALVHLDVAERGLAAVGRVRNCVPAGEGWRVGIELMPMP